MPIICPQKSILISIFVIIYIFNLVHSSNSSYVLATLKDYGPKTLEKIRWLHFPRAGSGFITTIMRYFCGISMVDEEGVLLKKQNLKGLAACKNNILAANRLLQTYPLQYEDNKYAAIIFRRPIDRLASQLRWMRAMVRYVVNYGVNEEDIDPLMTALSSVPNLKLLNSSNPCYFALRNTNAMRSCRYLAASHFPGLRGCMTKMILGKQCSERYQLTNTDLEEAKRILRNEVAFVGLTEKWQDSVRLFHSLYGGPLYSEELYVTTKVSPPAIENVRYALQNAYDYFDEEIYVTAVEVYERQKAQVEEKIKATGRDLY